MSQIDLMFLVHDMSMTDEQDNVVEPQNLSFYPEMNSYPSIYIKSMSESTQKI